MRGSSKLSAHRDWYLWRDPAPDGGPPNNWLSRQSGSAWEFDEATGQYYLHTYFPQQPDLNWRNPQVRLAMLDVLRFWLDRGVNGFRVDAVGHLIKDRRWRDNPPNPDFKPGDPPTRRHVPCYLRDQPELHEAIAWLRRLIDLYGDRILIGEMYLSPGRLVSYYGPQGLSFPFNFQLVEQTWTAKHLRLQIDSYEALLARDDWPSWVLGNHDRSRVASRIGGEKIRLAALLLLTLRGTPTMYYGDELGMRRRRVDARRDPRSARQGDARLRPRPPTDADALDRWLSGRLHPRQPLASCLAGITAHNVASQPPGDASLLSLPPVACTAGQ